jgi:glycosyltransferase involved in cell wall biosynthesis
MKILYIPNHAVLEYDELRLFSEFATSVFSAWFYADPANPTAHVRPGLDGIPVNERAAEIWAREQLTRDTCLLSREFTSCFDVVIAVADTKKLDYLLSATGLPVVIRMIGQSGPLHEAELTKRRNKCFIVRYSPAERFTPNYAGADAVIRFGKYASDFEVWNGGNGHVTTLYSSMSRRQRNASFDAYTAITEPFPRAMYGFGNPVGPWTRNGLSYNETLSMFASASVYYCCHTIPASYTLNLMEAMFTGCPIVTPGRAFIRDFAGSWDIAPTYEVPDFLDYADFTACPDDVVSGREAIAALLGDKDLAKRAGVRNREKANELFGAEKIAGQWNDFLCGVT